MIELGIWIFALVFAIFGSSLDEKLNLVGKQVHGGNNITPQPVMFFKGILYGLVFALIAIYSAETVSNFVYVAF